MKTLEEVRKQPDPSGMVQRSRELHAELAGMMEAARTSAEKQDSRPDFLVSMEHPETTMRTSLEAALNGDGKREVDGAWMPRQVALQPHRALDGIEGDPTEWAGERREDYAIGLAQAVYQIGLSNTMAILKVQGGLQRLAQEVEVLTGGLADTRRRAKDLEERLAKMDEHMGSRAERSQVEDFGKEVDSLKGAMEESRGRHEAQEAKVARLERGLGGRDNLDRDIRLLNRGIDELANAQGSFDLRHRIVRAEEAEGSEAEQPDGGN